MSGLSFADKAQRLRDAFDHPFSLPALETDRAMENLLMVRVDAETYGVKMSEIAGLFTGKTIVAMPSPVSAFLGLIGVKGSLVPVWSLAALLGYGTARNDPRWVVIGAGATPWALAFDAFEECRNVPRADLCPSTAEANNAKHVLEMCRIAGGVRPVLSLPSLRETIQTYFHSIDKRRLLS